jgi:Tol biopolymer transport system component
MTLLPATRLGPYEIVSAIGAGGMGEVFRARDTKLNRDIAIKVLPAAFADDPERLARFTREAQTLASLNHPNIATIYGIEDVPASGGSGPGSGSRALVMELVEGEDLSAHIARGPIPIAEALPIARQIAEALEAAHEQGIVHRDLKPANIKVRTDGTVKVLDFGLAKAMDPSGPSSPNVSNSPTLTHQGTMAGMIIGTAAYMSPEQAKGKPVDKRTDIWAFGVVLYEMLTGKRAFKGEDVSETLAAVLMATLSMDALPTATPPRLRRVVERCLERDLKTRLRDIGEARIEIARIDVAASGNGVTSAAPMPVLRGSRWSRVLPWAVAVISAGFAGWMATRPPPTPIRQVARVLLGVSPAERLLTGYPGDVSAGRGRPGRTSMTFSPDGHTVVFSAEREGRVQLYLRRLDELNAIPIAGTDGASTPFFSPDGQWLGFYAHGALKKVSAGGGPVVEVCSTELVFGASWSSRDQIVFANAWGGLFQVPAAGGTPSPVTKVQTSAFEVSHRLPQMLPDGDTVLFTVTHAVFPEWNDTSVVAQSLSTGTRRVLIEGGADARFVASGHLAYLRRGTLMAVPFDLRRLEVAGPAVGIVSEVMQAANIRPLQIDTGAGQFAVSNAGSLVYATGGVSPQDRWSIVWVDRMGRSEALNAPAGMWQSPRISPDGRRIAVGANAVGESDVWTYEVRRGALARVSMKGNQDIPVWTPDGSRLAVSSSVSGSGQLLLIDPEGRLPEERLSPTLGSGGAPGSWTTDGRELGFTVTRLALETGTRARSIWVAARDGKTEPRQLLQDAAMPDISTDGRWLSYVSGTAGNSSGTTGDVYVQPYPPLDHRTQISIGGGSEPVWRRDGREIFYLQNVSEGGALKVRVMSAPVMTTPSFSAGPPRRLFEGPFRIDGGSFRNYDVTADGQRFVMVREVERPQARVSQMVLVQNWVEELRRLAPTK